jgi:predicted outer membrane protein
MTGRIRWLLSALPLVVAACSPAAGPPPVVSAAPPAPPSHVAPADAAIATSAAQSSLFARELSRVAAEKAPRQGIRDFAQSVVVTETQSANRLASIVQPMQLELPQSLTPEQVVTVNRLTAAPDGPTFARTYFSALVRTQVGSLRRMESYASNGTEPELKSFATDQVPILRDQLARARRVPRQRGQTGT